MSPQAILLGRKVSDKEELFDLMIGALVEANGWGSEGAPDREVVKQAIWAREGTGGTSVGQGLAFPHGRIAGLSQMAVSMAVLAEPLPDEGPDGQRVDTVCLYVVPENDPTIGIRVMAAISELLSDPRAKRFVREARDPQRVWEFIHEKQLLMDRPIRARDIMRPEADDIRADMPLRRVTRRMLNLRTDALPVCDDEQHIVGHITCDLLFRRGIPAFFSQLASVSFVRQFDPFESYFAEEARAKAADVMVPDAPCLGEDATLMEILFLLSVRNRPKVFVIREGKLIGAIDRITVLDSVIHL